jgi:hypothetical protein
MKRFHTAGYQQIQIDLHVIKNFFKDYLIIDVENIIDGFGFEILKNCHFNTSNAESFDESVIILFILNIYYIILF